MYDDPQLRCVETVDMKDVDHCIDLLVAFVKSVKDDEKFRIEI